MKIPCRLLQSARLLGRIIPRYFLILAIAAISSAKAAPDENFTISELYLELFAIEPGTFQMGTPNGGNDDERPVMEVRITQPFWLGKTEVTQAQW